MRVWKMKFTYSVHHSGIQDFSIDSEIVAILCKFEGTDYCCSVYRGVGRHELSTSERSQSVKPYSNNRRSTKAVQIECGDYVLPRGKL